MINYEKLWITIPTYWGDYGSPDNPPCIDFDHPTSPDGEETLSRTMGSLCRLSGDFNLLIVLAVTHIEYLQKVRKRVEQILEPFRSEKKLYLVTPTEVEQINSLLKTPLLKMDSYGNIRNVQLFVPYCSGAEFVIGIDDDEIVEDREYLKKALNAMNENDDIGGMAGPYYDREGEFRLKGAEALFQEENIFLKKNYYMNEALKIAMSGESSPAPGSVAFGGNMVFRRDTIARVCHDPFIPRGEDYDYVINALMKGIRFYFHQDIGIVHLPPDSTGSQAGDNVRKLKADIRRFLYMKTKLTEHRKQCPQENFSYDLLNPYPGAFLDDSKDLPEHAVSALLKGYSDHFDAESSRDFVKQASEESVRKAAEFFNYRQLWHEQLSLNSTDTVIGAAIARMCFIS
ncbi:MULTISPECIES: hypothetical protein [unclassified Oceanispirochaeta]|uniref:glycosyltransferase family 2 protein n=1 Tax=unclassified Oceanispirochaeta TaxID=2635722 RepID=UPI000E09C750|nr:MULTISPECIES: hypothetical protein [unclassified Oceanispirochaeta]MBF9016904.1 hypothetical protein [Oceanispirochaeta sp. M2]NPD73267.1 hypothetical protein [Oceanispirochaeta sp. M1]RDG31133.1 hypothetical protein DV872_14295 [Oceanispirochaeta sp. M1]